MKWVKTAITSLLLTNAGTGPAIAQSEAFSSQPPPDISTVHPAEPFSIPLYGAKTPGRADSENWACTAKAGCFVRNVTRPTLTPILPAPGKGNGAAVVVLPGGAFTSLSIDNEGTRVARGLAERGIAAFVLKYRLIQTPVDWKEAQTFQEDRLKKAFASPEGPASLFNPDALRDGQQALKVVRDRSAEWGVDARRVGMIGFSAGARTALRVVRETAPADLPAFFGYIYGDLSEKTVPPNAPPMFTAIAFDDALYPKGDFSLAQAWHAAGRPVELHAYLRGGHGFGIGVEGWTNGLLLEEFSAWLAMQDFLKSTSEK